MSVVFERTKYLTDKQFHYCPGCNHGIIHRLVAECIDELQQEGIIDRNVAGVDRYIGTPTDTWTLFDTYLSRWGS